MEEKEQQQQHFLVATYPFQGHINPALHLARHLASTAAAARVTFSTAVSAHHRMVPSSAASPVGEEFSDGQVSYVPFSDGHDDGYPGGVDSFNEYTAEFNAIGSKNFSKLVGDLATRGPPVTCIIYTILLPWAADVARDHGIPSVPYWIQPAAVFAVYYHYFHGYEALIATHRNDPHFTVDLPGLLSLQIKDIPCFLTMSTDDPLYSVLLTLRELFDGLDKEPRARVLVNTFDALQPDGLSAVDKVDLISIGPVLPSDFSVNGTAPKGNTTAHGHLFKLDKKGYMEWLDSKPEKSVVYVSFGSLSTVKMQQLEEMLMGLEESGRPYLWVVRKDNRGEGVELERGENGMVVEWCNQVQVLSHPSVGCFVTHCGWNSMVESLACGVPTVGVPRLSDQWMNARVAVGVWGTGVRAEMNEEGVLEGQKLRRSLDVVMGEGERGAEIRRKAEIWREKAMEAMREGGSSDQNLRAFMKGIQHGW